MKKEPTKVITIMIPQSMYDALNQQADQRDTNMSAIIRFAVEQLMTAWGEPVRDDIMWGGARYSPKKKDDTAPPEGVGMFMPIS